MIGLTPLLALSSGSIDTQALNYEASVESVRSDRFKFTYYGMPIGEVSLEYIEAVGAVPEIPELNSRPGDHGFDRSGGKLLSREPRTHATVLGALSGKTNGLVRWIKTYEGFYQSIFDGQGSRYLVNAKDRGIKEHRDIYFGRSAHALPIVQGFIDRTATASLQPVIGVDENSLDPISLMQRVLADVAEQSGCPRKERAYRVFDGKRRYLAILGGAHDRSDSNPKRDEIGDALGGQIGQTPAHDKTVSIQSQEISLSDSSWFGTIDSSYRQPNSQDSHTASKKIPERAEGLIKREETATNMRAGLSEENQSAPNVIKCELRLMARSSLVASESEHPYSPGQSTEDSIDLSAISPVDGRERKEAHDPENPNPPHEAEDNLAKHESRTAVVDIKSHPGENSTSPADEKLTNQPAQNGLFWPFNRSELHVDFEILRDQGTARYLKFDIDAPMGRIKGTRVRGKSDQAVEQ